MARKFKDSKDPDSIEFFEFDWEDWLQGATITNSEWLLTNGLTKSNESLVNSNQGTRVRLAGGTLGTFAEATNRITNSLGEVEDWTLQLMIESH